MTESTYSLMASGGLRDSIVFLEEHCSRVAM